MTTVDAAEAKVKKIHGKEHLVVGMWKNGNFEARAEQPAEPIYHLEQMKRWLRGSVGANNAEYYFIRAIPGRFVLRTVSEVVESWEI